MFDPANVRILIALTEQPWYEYGAIAREHLVTNKGLMYVLPHVTPLLTGNAISNAIPVETPQFRELEEEGKFLVTRGFGNDIRCGVTSAAIEFIQSRRITPLVIVGPASEDEIRGKCPNANIITMVNIRTSDRSPVLGSGLQGAR